MGQITNQTSQYITIYILYKVKTMSSQTQQRIEITSGIRNIWRFKILGLNKLI